MQPSLVRIRKRTRIPISREEILSECGKFSYSPSVVLTHETTWLLPPASRESRQRRSATIDALPHARRLLAKKQTDFFAYITNPSSSQPRLFDNRLRSWLATLARSNLVSLQLSLGLRKNLACLLCPSNKFFLPRRQGDPCHRKRGFPRSSFPISC